MASQSDQENDILRPAKVRIRQVVKVILDPHWDRLATVHGNLAYLSPKDTAQKETNAGYNTAKTTRASGTI